MQMIVPYSPLARPTLKSRSKPTCTPQLHSKLETCLEPLNSAVYDAHQYHYHSLPSDTPCSRSLATNRACTYHPACTHDPSCPLLAILTMYNPYQFTPLRPMASCKRQCRQNPQRIGRRGSYESRVQ